jgi:hypothetical protein
MGEGAGVPDCAKVEVCNAFASILHIILSSANLVFHSIFSLALHPSQGDFVALKVEGNSKVTFSGLPMSDAVAWAAKMQHHSTLAFGGEL